MQGWTKDFGGLISDYPDIDYIRIKKQSVITLPLSIAIWLIAAFGCFLLFTLIAVWIGMNIISGTPANLLAAGISIFIYLGACNLATDLLSKFFYTVEIIYRNGDRYEARNTSDWLKNFDTALNVYASQRKLSDYETKAKAKEFFKL